MRKAYTIKSILALLLALAGLVWILASLQSYETLKAIGGSLVVDGDFNSLKESNVLVFKILLGSTGILSMLLAAGVFWGDLHKLFTGFRSFCSDASLFFSRLIPPRNEWKFIAGLGLVVLMAAVIRLKHLNNPMSHDESYTFIVFASTSIFNIISNYHLPNNHVFHTLLVGLSTSLMGIQPWVIRLPSFLAGLSLIPATYVLSRLIYDRYTGLASAVCVAIFYGPVAYATSARGYSLVSLFTILMLCLGIYVYREKNRFAWMLLVLFATLGFYTVPVMLYPFGIVYAWLFLENLGNKISPGDFAIPSEGRQYRSKMEFIKFWLAGGLCTALLVLILYTPIFIYSGADKVFSNQWVSPTTWESFLRSTPVHLRNTWSEWFFGEAPWVPILLVVGFLLSILFHRRIAKHRFPLQLAAIGWVTVLLLIQRTHTGPKIFAFLQPPFLIWACAGYMGLLKEKYLRFFPKISLPAVAVGVLLVVGLFRGAQAIGEIPYHWSNKGAIEHAVLYIQEHLGDDDLVIVDSPSDAPTWYYARLFNLPGGLFDRDLPFSRLWVIVSPKGEKSLPSVLQERGPDLSLIKEDEASLLWNTGDLDLYLVPHR